MLYCYRSVVFYKKSDKIMSETMNRTPAQRQKRVQMLKKIIVMTLVISILIPIVLCIVLLVYVHGIHSQLENLNTRVEQLETAYINQQEQLEILLQSETMTQKNAVNEGANDASDAGIYDITGVMNEEKNLRKVYLTFDDGPSIYTKDILDILDRYDVKATFFVVGKEGAMAEEALQEIVNRGHTLGMHSYTHKYEEIYHSVEDFSADFQRLQDYLYEVTGVRSTMYRFPGGSSNTVSEVSMMELVEYLDEQGVVFHDWNASSGDAKGNMKEVDVLVENTIQGVKTWQNAIVLFHDSKDKSTTVEALPIIIENILAMEDTVILPITEDTVPVQHIDRESNK